MIEKDGIQAPPEIHRSKARPFQFTEGLNPGEVIQVTGFLDRLTSFMPPEDYTIVGSLALRHHLGTRRQTLQRPFRDADVVVDDPMAVSPLVMAGFLVMHVHPLDADTHGHSGIFLKLVDPTTKVKLDILPQHAKTETTTVGFKEKPVKISTLEDQLATTINEVQGASEERRIAHKLPEKIRMLFPLANREVLENLWEQKFGETTGLSLTEALTIGREQAEKNPEYFCRSPFRGQQITDCERCISLPALPIASREQVLSALQ